MLDTIKNRSRFQLSAASVAGRDHLAAGRNNQDSFALEEVDGALVAAVADGCGAAPFSELGARLGSQLCVRAIARKLRSIGGDPAGSGLFADRNAAELFLEALRLELLAQLRPIALALAGSDDSRALTAVVRDQLLFTLVGAIATPGGVLAFALGDGAAALDGQLAALGPFPGNEPPYLGYALLPESAHGFSAESLRFQLVALGPARTLALGSDGALDLFASSPPASLFDEPLLFNNPDALRRKLWLLARDRAGSGRALLRDDTTLVLLRLAQELSEA